MSLLIPVSPGELLDKLTILQVKKERIADKKKRGNIVRELSCLETVYKKQIQQSGQLTQLISALRTVNETLWDIEDDIRCCERRGDFGSSFVELARSVYKTNDHRARLKQRINDLLDSELVEEKSYEAY